MSADALLPGHSQILRPYYPASWFHPIGIHKVLAKIEPRLPDVGGKLFLTFTFNPALFATPSLAFEAGRDRLRRIFFKLRRGVPWEGKTHLIDSPYCVKVEFHASGWPHFHVIYLTRRHLPGELLNSLWGLGRTNVGRIKNAGFRYLLKYVTKGGDLPEWVQDRSRLRVFQTSRGFYREGTSRPKAEKHANKMRRKRCTTSLGQRLEAWSKSALLQNGDQFYPVHLCAPFVDLLAELILPVALDRRYLGNGHVIINDTQHLIPWITKKPNTPAADSSSEA